VLKMAFIELYMFFTVHFRELLNKTPTECTCVYFQLTHLHVSAQKSHPQGGELQNTSTSINIGPSIVIVYQCELRTTYYIVKGV
jgi:hypothetical protein